MKLSNTARALLAGATLALSAPLVADSQPVPAKGLDPVTMERLQNNRGITLQWIGWDQRGIALVRRGADGTVRLSGGQIDPKGAGTLWLDGKVIEAGPDYFVFDGLIRIAETPDEGRVCEAKKRWHFAITQNRKYYRLREFEWCDGLTDYIDIYF
ncbi:hypothetical protein [Parerythrobacter lacustris]|uniref:DUF995 domain-containing protein n=1 Tax=Parerythrobacter lacustris TaxID=2969984 RepID=A0ABT1XPZ5_9SPHN|nr:hypothetical protein [Parerythrobacter lacustris]MCR2832695.1 hypothetical protein [Parerythrobacter lacustris]